MALGLQDGASSSRYAQLYDDALLRHARARQAATMLPEEYTFGPALTSRAAPEGLLSPHHHTLSVSDRQVSAVSQPICSLLSKAALTLPWSRLGH